MVYADFELRVAMGEIPPELLIRFDAVTGDAFVPVGELELYQQLCDPSRRAFRDKLSRPYIPLLTAILVGVQIRIYLASWSSGTEAWLQSEWTQWGPAIYEQGEVWRLFSYGLLHLNFSHLLFNLTFLAYTGYNLERALGRLNLGIIFFGSVFFGGTLSMLMDPSRPSLGASAGDFGLIAAAVVFGWKHVDLIPASSRTKFGWALVPYLAFSLISGLRAENVDNWGHLGGLIAGGVLMTVLSPELSPRDQRTNRWWQAGTVGLCGLVMALLVIFGMGWVPLKASSEGNWMVSVPSYWRAGTSFTGDQAWFSPTGVASMVVTHTVHDRPIGPTKAVDRLVQQIVRGADNATVVSRSPVTVAGAVGEALAMRFSLADGPKTLNAVVLTRGVVSYRVQIQAKDALVKNYESLWARVVSEAVLTDAADLVLATERSANHPRSWTAAVDLGDALYRAGQARRAVTAYERALVWAPTEVRALVGRLRAYEHYGLVGGLDLARETLNKQPAAQLHPQVRAAAVALLDATGAKEE